MELNGLQKNTGRGNISLEDIIKYKDYQIVLLNIDNNVPMDYNRWVCAYVYLEDLDKILPESTSYETFRHKNIVGVDTIHSYNERMTFEQKKEDAIRQIMNIIHEYETNKQKV